MTIAESIRKLSQIVKKQNIVLKEHDSLLGPGESQATLLADIDLGLIELNTDEMVDPPAPPAEPPAA